MCMYMQIPIEARRVVSSELQTVVSHLTWVLGTEFGSSVRNNSLNY